MAEKKEEKSIDDSINALQRFLNAVGSAENLLGALKTAQAADGKKADWENQAREAEKRKKSLQAEIDRLRLELETKRQDFDSQIDAMANELKTSKDNHKQELEMAENYHAGQMAGLADELKERKSAVQKEKRELADDLNQSHANFEDKKLELESRKDALLAEIDGLESYRNQIREKLGQASA